MISTHHYFYINNVIGAYVRGLGDFLRTELYPRTTEIVIGTYEKAVQHYMNKIRTSDGEFHGPAYPFITLDPRLDFEPEERAGRFLYQYPQFDNAFAAKVFEPKIYEDRNMSVSPVLNRYKGRFEVIIWCGSVYEAIDNKIWTYQFFGGTGRPIKPKNIEGYIVLPDELVFYNYNNRYTQQSYQIDWSKTEVGTTLVKNINQDKYVYPFTLNPFLTLTDISDASEKYGGDQLSEYKLTMELEWEAHIPTHLVFEVDELPNPMWRSRCEVSIGFNYIPAMSRGVQNETIISGVLEDEGEQVRRIDMETEHIFSYILEQADIDNIKNETNVLISLESAPDKPYHIQVWGKLGEMIPSFHWRFLNEDVTTGVIELISFAIGNEVFIKDDIITIIKYVETPS